MTTTSAIRRQPIARLAAILGGGWLGILSVSAPAQGLNLAGPQIWNADYWQTTCFGDYYGANFDIKKLRPISLAGCRNGAFSGYVVLTCGTAPITGLKATITDLAEKGGKKIPADRVLIRYPELARPETSWAPAYRFDRMLDQPPEEVKMADLKSVRDWKPKKPGPNAMQPVWVTVRVPADAAPGDYEGTLTVEAENTQPIRMPVKIRVADWALPDPKNFSVQNLAYYSPECVARYYDVELWSDKHFELMGKSMALMLQVGSRHAIVNLVCNYPAQDNRQSMVRWIKQADGSYRYDFTAVDKYFDLCAKVIGKPFPIRINAWASPRKDSQFFKVTTVDPASGQLGEIEQPPYGTPENLAFWKPVLTELRARLEKRGWFDTTVMNWINYCGGPDTNIVDNFHAIWPDGRWSSMDHGRRVSFSTSGGVQMPVPVSLAVWQEGNITARGYKGHVKPGFAIGGHARGRHREWFDLWIYRALNEEMLMRSCHGSDPMGADLWPTRDERGRIVTGSWQAYALGPGNCTKALLGPGEDGAVATERFEAFREGVQIAEAILFIQRALDGGKLPADLAAKANTLLDDRSKRMLDSLKLADKSGAVRFDPLTFSENAEQRENDLFALAAQVAKTAK